MRDTTQKTSTPYKRGRVMLRYISTGILVAVTYLGSEGPLAAHNPQPWLPMPPQFKFILEDVPSIQDQPRFTAVAVLDCDAPAQKSADKFRENANIPEIMEAPAIVSRCEFIGQEIITVHQSKVFVPVTFKHDAWPSEPSMSL
jgi:hypothetical protein